MYGYFKALFPEPVHYDLKVEHIKEDVVGCFACSGVVGALKLPSAFISGALLSLYCFDYLSSIWYAEVELTGYFLYRAAIFYSVRYLGKILSCEAFV